MEVFNGTARDVLDNVREDMKKEVVTLDRKSNFFVALWVLQKNEITSAPVLDEEGKVVGICDLLDLVACALMTYEDRKQLFEREMLQFASSELSHSDVQTIANMSMRNRLELVGEDTPVGDIVRLFSAAGGLHRVVVRGQDGKLSGLISQTDLLRHIARREYRALEALRVGEWARKELVSCSPLSEASKAFEKLIDERVSALPVLDGDGRLVTSFSASDLKGAEP